MALVLSSSLVRRPKKCKNKACISHRQNGFRRLVIDMPKQWDIELVIKSVKLYLKGIALYGFTRAVTWGYEGSKEYYNATTHEYETKEKLLVDKARGVLGGTFSAYFAWPFMISDDLKRLECVVKGLDPQEYSK